jgi:hypothetical protein
VGRSPAWRCSWRHFQGLRCFQIQRRQGEAVLPALSPGGKTRCDFPLLKSSTGNLWTHLRSHHSALVDELKDEKAAKAKGVAALGFKIVPMISDQEKITRQIAKWIALSLRPVHLVRDAEFRVLLTMLNPMYQLPQTTAPFKNRIVDLKNSIRGKIRAIVQGASANALTVDEWTSNANSKFMAITCHTIDSEWTMHSFTLAVSEMLDRSFANVLAAMIKRVAKEYGIKDNLISITTDGASDIGKACEILQESKRDLGLSGAPLFHYWCACHRLNLALGDAIKVCACARCSLFVYLPLSWQSSRFDKLLTKVRPWVKLIRKSGPAHRIFQTYQKTHEIKRLRLIIDVITRWNSIFDMINSLLRNKQALVSAIPDIVKARGKGCDLQPLDIDDWALLEQSFELLEPFKKLTVHLSGQRYVTISSIAPMISNVYTKMKESVESGEE